MSQDTDEKIQDAVREALEEEKKRRSWTVKDLADFVLNARALVAALGTAAAAFGGWGWAKSADTSAIAREASDSAVARVRREMAPTLDSMRQRAGATDRKVDGVDAKMDALIGVMQDAFPQFKKAAQERARRNMDSREIREALEGQE